MSVQTAEDQCTVEEGWAKMADGHEVYTKTWKPSESPIARLVFIHGYSDHINSYGSAAPALAAAGIAVYAYDQRGWGRSVKSPAERGRSGPTTQVLDDITSFIKSVPANSDAPLFLMGHSMGGGEILQYAALGPQDVLSQIRGFLAEAPLIGIHPDTKPWKVTVTMGRLAGKLLPHNHMKNPIDSRKLSRDPAVGKRFEADPLCHETGTLEGLAGMLDRTSELDEGRVVIKEGVGEGGKVRLWIGHGTADGVCDFEATKQFFERTKVEDKQLAVYEGWVRLAFRVCAGNH
jgi:acylglycerol lipase